MEAGGGGGRRSPAKLEELYRQAMRQQQEYSPQRRVGTRHPPEPEPAVARPKAPSPNHDELLVLPTDERLPPEAWSSPQPWREQRAKSPATTRQQSGLANRRARSRGAARSSSNTRRRSGSGQRPPWQSPRSPFDDFIQSPPPVEARSRSQSASRARSREGRYADPTAATWLRQRPPSAKRERPQQHGSTALTPRGAGSGPRHGGSSLREKVGLSRRDDRQVPAPAVAASRHRGDGFERAKRARKKKDPACTFQPQISQRSRTITDLARPGTGMPTVEDSEGLETRSLQLTERLHADFEKTQHKLSKLRKQHERAKKKDPECTFAPTLKVRNGYKGKGERSVDEAHRAEPRITTRKMEASADRLYSTHEQTQARKTAQIKKRDEMIKKTGAEFSEASRFLAEFGWDVEKASKEFFKTRPRWGAGGTRISTAQKEKSADRLSEYKTRKFVPDPKPAGDPKPSGFGCSVPSTRLPSSRSVRVARLPGEFEDRLHNVPQHRQTDARRASSTPRLSRSQSQTQTGPPASAHPLVLDSHSEQSGARQNTRVERQGPGTAEQPVEEARTANGVLSDSAKRESGSEDQVRKILKHFYDTNHPEFASPEQINEFIRYYKEKAESNGRLEHWQDLLWAAYEGQGVDPRKGYRDSAVA